MQIPVADPMLPAAFDRLYRRHRLNFVPAGRTLVVTFDAASVARTGSRDRKPWGYDFFHGEGHSVLGVIAFEATWFRDADLTDALVTLAREGFFAAFDKVMLTGSSMGGYGAAVFASLAPGCTVLSFIPQSTLDPAATAWETRYPRGSAADWSPPFCDAPSEIGAAARVYLVYDPLHELDRAHAARFDGQNVVRLHIPYVGHTVPTVLQALGLLKTVSRGALSGDLTREGFALIARNRRRHPFYFREMIRHLALRGRFAAAITLCRSAESQFPPHFFSMMRAVLEGADGNIAEAFKLVERLGSAAPPAPAPLPLPQAALTASLPHSAARRLRRMAGKVLRKLGLRRG